MHLVVQVDAVDLGVLAGALDVGRPARRHGRAPCCVCGTGQTGGTRATHRSFAQTETCFLLSLVNGSRFQPAHRSCSRMPAMWAMRSSSAGHTLRKVSEV